MSALNKIILLGKVVDAPDIKVSTNGDPVAKLILTVPRPRGSNPESIPKQDVFTVIAWGNLADTITEYKVGQDLIVEGRIQQRSIEDSEGNRKWLTEIIARQTRSVFPGASSSENSEPLPASQNSEIPAPVSNEIENKVLDEKPDSFVSNSAFSFSESSKKEDAIPF